MSAHGFSPEFLLVAACCRPRSFADFDDGVQSAARGRWDAALLLDTARAHRVEGFVDDGLNRAGIALPAPTADLLSERASKSRVQMLRNAGEEVRLDRLFAEHGIEPVFLKGATLGMLAHGTLALKTSWDIDLLVAPEHLALARRLLSEAGYRPELDGLEDPELIETYFRRSMETLWRNEARGTWLELHRALVETHTLLRGVGPESPRQRVALTPGSSVATLAPELLFAYLCVHGTTHRWERLKWLADVAALLAVQGTDGRKLLETAKRIGAGRAVATALELSHLLFGTEPIGEPARDGRTTLGVNTLIAISLSTLSANSRPTEATALTVGDMITKSKVKWLQGDSFRSKLPVIAMLLDYSPVESRLRIPDRLLRLHMLVWLPWRLMTRRWRYRQHEGGNAARRP